MAERRRVWRAAQPYIDTDRLVFIDETGASTKMMRPYGEAEKVPVMRSIIGIPRRSRPTRPASHRLSSFRPLEDHHLRGGAHTKSLRG